MEEFEIDFLNYVYFELNIIAYNWSIKKNIQ